MPTLVPVTVTAVVNGVSGVVEFLVTPPKLVYNNVYPLYEEGTYWVSWDGIGGPYDNDSVRITEESVIFPVYYDGDARPILDRATGEYRLVDGDEVVSPQYTDLLTPFHAGFTGYQPVPIPRAFVQDGDKILLIDTAGDPIETWNATAFDMINLFHWKKELAFVSKDGKWSAIDMAGKTVIPLEYKNLWVRDSIFSGILSIPSDEEPDEPEEPSNNIRIWDASNRALNLVINNLKGTFFPDDNIEHMAFTVYGCWSDTPKMTVYIGDCVTQIEEIARLTCRHIPPADARTENLGA